MSIDPDAFRSTLGRFATGVTVVTTVDAQGHDYGMTVSAFSSLSLSPPLVLVCIGKSGSVHPAITSATSFVVNVLESEQEPLSRRFATEVCDRFEGIGFQRGQHGAVILDDVLAWLECRRVALHDGGDHTIVVGEVENAHVNDGSPLLYYRGGYARLER